MGRGVVTQGWRGLRRLTVLGKIFSAGQPQARRCGKLSGIYRSMTD